MSRARVTAPDMDLSAFPPAVLPEPRSPLMNAAWYLTCALVFQNPLALLPSAVKCAVLRAFGAEIGRKVVIKPRVTVKYPWLLSIGDNSWIGENVWIDNPGRVEIGANVCVSQGSYLVTGNHDFSDPRFRFFAVPIEVGDRCWIMAQAILPPGSAVPAGTVVPVGQVWRNGVG
jgi:putative colanic acid biosynthesis acetyltransferase WcaF